MGLALSLGMGAVAAYAIRGLSRVAQIPLKVLVSQILPALCSGLLMAGTVLVLDREVVHAQHADGLVGIVLFALDLLVAGIVYLGFLVVMSRRSAAELKELVALLVERRGNSNSPAP